MLRNLRTAKAFIFDFYGTLIENDVSVPPMWRYLGDLGYKSNAELETMFEPNAFDGCRTPTGVAHDDWLNDSWRAFLRLSGVPQHEIESTLASLLWRRETFDVHCADGVLELLKLLRER